MKQKIFALLLCAALVLSLAGCGSTVKIAKYKIPDGLSVAETKTVAENDRFSLRFDSEGCVMLCDRAGTALWSTVPYDFFRSGDTSSSLNSPLMIQYYNPSDGGLESAKAYSECISEGAFSAEEVENGVKMTFYFASAEVTIPLYFTLREDSVAVSIPAGEIVESGKTELIEVSVLPYFCATPNAADREHYLFFPAGSGALAYTDGDVTNVSRSCTAEVYGVDYGRKLLDHPFDGEPVRMPVYGVKNGGNALFAIVESGDGSAKLTADVGNTRNGYSTVYPTFQVRSYDETETARNNYSDERIYAAEFDKELTYTVGYYPLTGEDADYCGMARRYQKYLGLDSAEKTAQQPYHLQFLGGDLTKHFFMGVPYMAMTAATKFSDTADIMEELKKETGYACAATLQGFGGTGNTAGKIAGGYGFASAFGGMKGYRAVSDFCEKNGIPLFASFDLMRFHNRSAAGSPRFDTAKTASRQKSVILPLTKNLRFAEESGRKICLLKREKLPGVTKRLISFADGKLSGIALDGFGDVLYSDYTSAVYASKGCTDQMTDLIKWVSQAGHPVSANGANAYAAVAADVLTGVSLQDSGEALLDETVPFYQLVFGKKPMYSEPINLATDPAAMLLRAVAAGVSPTFSVCADYEEKLETAANGHYYGSLYSGIRDDVIRMIGETGAFYSAIGNAYLTSYTPLGDGAGVSVFSNGVRVVVNPSDRTVVSDGLTAAPGTFAYSEAKEALT